MRKERKSNLELLRIKAMLLIVASHYAGWIVPAFTAEKISVNRILNQTLCFGGGAGNILFFLISGYFFGNSFSKKKIFMVWFEMFFYSVICFAAACVLSGVVSIRSLIAAVFPFSHSEYWFMTSYMILMILLPWIGILIDNMDCRKHQRLLFLLFLFCSVIPSIPGCPTTAISDVGFYLFIYLLGTYIKRYPNDYSESRKLNLAVVLICLVGIAGSIACFDFLGKNGGFFADNAGYFTRMRSPFVILFSWALFNVFRKMEMKDNKGINYISGSVFAVYLIHNNKNIRSYMWENIFKSVEADSLYLFLHLIVSVGGIFVVCVLFDVLRREILERSLVTWIDKHPWSKK